MDVMKHGGDVFRYCKESGLKREEIVDFSANINPLGPPPLVMRVLQERLFSIYDYPDPHCRELRHIISRRWEISDECICIGNGAAELIFLVMRVLQPKRLLTVAPTFREYEQAARLEGAVIEKVHLLMEEGADFPLDEFVQKIADVHMVVLANPNNPTGQCIKKEALDAILETAAVHGVYVLLDEAFLDFVADESERTQIRHVESYPNLIVIRSMTKFYAIPGLRVGYACATREMIRKMREHQVPWSVNSLAQIAAISAFSDESFHEKTLRWLQEERELMQSELSVRGYDVFPSDTNFLLVRHSCFDIEKEWKRLAEKGIFIRDCRSFTGLDSRYFRIAIRTREENLQLLRYLPVFRSSCCMGGTIRG
ncbi:threonine-phosphate decarboxylase [Collibacillus ludicampi]|uniref:threonine-phosphate decarboxylase n=2 Tax=Collibacillus ludicampi TaxID=2771369 RepID=A0AAV4LHS3_9BACL|nr:threonine-phosphate decarboxylase [Collibacillus ludicampi]